MRVVAHERTTDLKREGFTESDGTFNLGVLDGVYDLGFDKEGDLATATCFYGPVTTGQADYILYSTNGRSQEKVFGRIWLQPGVPAVQRKVNLVSAHGRGDGDRPADIAGRTEADGSFEISLSLDNERALDLEVYDGEEQLDEFVDFGKLSKPCYIEIATEQTAVENVLRAGESGPDTSPIALQTNAGLIKFNFAAVRVLINLSGYGFDMTGGSNPVDGIARKMYDLVRDPGEDAAWVLGNSDMTMKVAANGSWWWKYAVNLESACSRTYKFTDASPDTYSLWIADNALAPLFNRHKVSYNSFAPNIVKIHMSPDTTSGVIRP